MTFLKELMRRNVFKVGAAYVIVGWLLIQGASILLPAFGAPHWFEPVFYAFVIAGLPIALIVAWAFELTPQGIKRTEALVRPSPKSAPAKEAPRPAAISTVPSIAVLPFADMSPDRDQEYFSDGLTEELINSLCRINDLQVTGRTSSFAFKGKNDDLRTIGDTLGVQYILEGSVRKAGDDIRITAQLINAATSYHLWSKTYERKFEDVFSIQDNIAKSVADALEIVLGVGDLARIEGGTKNVRAYDEYLRGRWLRMEEVDAGRAVEHLERAVDLDPAYALAWLALSDACAYGLILGTPDRSESWQRKQHEALTRATALAPESANGLAAAAQAHELRREWLAAERLYEEAMQRSARVPPAFSLLYARFLNEVGRSSEGIEHARKYQRAEPLDPNAYATLGSVLAGAGRADEALMEMDAGLARIGGQLAFLRGAACAIAFGTVDRTRIEERVDAICAVDPVHAPIHRGMKALLDDREAALARLRELVAETGSASPLRQAILALWAAYFGDLSLSIRALSVAMKVGPGLHTWTWPAFVEVRKQPGFKDVLRDLGLVDYWRASGHWGDFYRPAGDDDFECRQ